MNPWTLAKRLLPDDPRTWPVLRGPAQGALVSVIPRDELFVLLGAYEPEITDHVQRTTQTPNGTVIDVGAGTGYYAILYAHHGHTVHAYEPDPDRVQRIQQAESANGPGIEIHRQAVGSAVDLDDRHDEARGLKIDVDGDEARILEGATQLLDTIDWTIVETHSHDLRDACAAQLDDAGLTLTYEPARPTFPRTGTVDPGRGWLIAYRDRLTPRTHDESQRSTSRSHPP